MATTFNDIAELNDFMVEQEIIRNTNEKARIEREKTRAELFDKLQTLENEHLHGEAERQENEKNRQVTYAAMLTTLSSINEQVQNATDLLAALKAALVEAGADAATLDAAIKAAQDKSDKLTYFGLEDTEHDDQHIIITVNESE